MGLSGQSECADSRECCHAKVEEVLDKCNLDYSQPKKEELKFLKP